MPPFSRILALLLTFSFLPYLAGAQATLLKVKSLGRLTCGIVREEPEYSNLDAHGNRALFDVDLCKAIAISILGPAARFDVTAFPDETEALKALQTGTVEVIASATPAPTASSLGLTFGRTMLFDFQGLMINTAMGVHSIGDLSGKKICYLTETNMELNLVKAMAARKINFIPFPFQEEGEMEAAFLTNNCAAISADVTQLAYERIAFRAKGLDYEMLPDVLANDPLASATRTADAQWSSLVNSVDGLLVRAEETGITSANVGTTSLGDDAHRQFLTTASTIGRPVGLDEAWAQRTIKGVGNYGEIFERDLGPATPMRLVRGPNRLRKDNGLLTAAPL